MKRPIIQEIYYLFFTFILLMVLANVSQAEENRTETGSAGLFGSIQLGGGYLSARPSGLEVLDNNERRSSLNGSGGNASQGVALVSAELGYTFNATGSTLLAAINPEGPISVSLRQDVGKIGELTLGALLQVQEVWQNPYLTGVDRRRTDADSFGYAVKWDRIGGTGAWLSFQQLQTDIEDDRIGQIESQLRRDGWDTTMALGYTLDLAECGRLVPSLAHREIDRKGAANSGQGFTAELMHQLEVGRLTLATRLAWERTDFDGVHPSFGKKREENGYGLSERVSFADPFGFKNWSVFAYAAYQKTNATITFFDRSALLTGAGIGYRF